MTMTNTENVEFILEESQEDTAYISSVNDLLESISDGDSAMISGGAAAEINISATGQGQEFVSTITSTHTYAITLANGKTISYGYGFARVFAVD